MQDWWWWGIVAAVDVFAIGLAVWRGHGVAGTLAWIFAILAFPGLGALLYLTLGRPRIRTTVRRRRRALAFRRQHVGGRGEALLSGVELPEVVAGGLLHLARAMTDLPPTGGNQVELLAESHGAFERIEQALEGAEETIWAEFYLVRNDLTGRGFLEHLQRRARDGVQVRFLYDAIGSFGLERQPLEELKRAGGRIEAFLPANPLRRRWSIHLRNHRKLVVVDGRIGFTGGMNLGDEYRGSRRRGAPKPFRDTHLRLAGPAAGQLAQIFAEDWTVATGELIEPPDPQPGSGDAVVSLVPSGPDQELNANAVLYFAALGNARRRAFVASPYFAPDEPTLRALQSAALRGVDVRLLLPAECDVPLVKAAASSYYAALLSAGVRIFEYRAGMLHAKTLLVDDDFGLVGSANVDVRSFRLNFELGALVGNQRFVTQLEERFAEDFAKSLEITAQEVAARGVWQRLRDGAARLLSPIL